MACHVQCLCQLAALACQKNGLLLPGGHGLREDQCDPLLRSVSNHLPRLIGAEPFIPVRYHLTRLLCSRDLQSIS